MKKEETGQANEELNLLRCRVAELEQAEAENRRIEEKLRLERDFNATIIQAAPLFFVTIAADGRTLMMNEAMLQALGYTADEVVDRDYLTTFVPERDREALSQIFATLTTSHEPTLNKNRVLTKAGRELLVEWHGRQVFKEDGALDFFFGAGVDITERVQTEALYQAIGNPTLILDPEHNIISANRAAAKVTGQPEEKLVGKKCYEVLHNTDAPPEGCPFVKMLASSRMETAEMEIEALGRTYLVSCTPVLNERGELEKIIHVATDITEDKHAERRMEHLSLVLRAIRNVNQLIVHEKDRDTLIQRACDLLIEARGYYNAWIALFDESGTLVTSVETGLGEIFTPLIEKLENGELTACGQRALAQSGVVSTEDPPSACADCPLAMSYVGRGALTVRLEHGCKVYGVLSASIPRERIADEEEQGLFNEVAGDIAFALHNIEVEEKRVQAEAALRQSERLLTNVFDSIQDGISILDTDLTIRRTNASIKKWHAANLPLEGKKCYACYQNREIPCDPCPTLRCIQSGKTENNIVLVEGSPAKWIELFSYPMKNPNSGEVTSVVEFVRDITKRVRAELELQIEREKLTAIFESMEDGIYIVNKDYDIQYVNPVLQKTFGLPEGKKCHKYFHDSDEPCAFCKNEDVFAGKTVHWEWTSPKNGRTYDLIDTPMKNPDGSVFKLEIFRDITERVRAEKERLVLEAQLRQGQKLESIGTLASGVAHEINNPLMGMINYADLIESRIKDAQLKQFAQGIIKEGNRVAEIVKSLLSFARQGNQSHSPARMEDIIDTSLMLVGAVLRKDQIAIEKEIAQDLPQVRCRSQQIEQVIINLLTNARDALNERYPDYHENKLIKIQVQPFEKDGIQWIRMTVEDHGAGISEEIIARVFDPFFTTKPRDVGTGLGLSVSYGIIKDHHGELTVESEPGKYTRFHIDLRVNNGWKLG